MTINFLELEKRIAADPTRFEIPALLEQILRLGYSEDNIRYRSHHCSISQAALIHSIDFQRLPRRRVTITMNLGLLSAQSPLPAYFFKNLDYADMDTEAFCNFIAFFDHHVIREYILNLYPEMNRLLFPNLEGSKRQYMALMEARAPTTMKWLFDLVFPELGVNVEKAILGRGLSNDPIILGVTKLGSDAVFGKVTKVPVRGLRVSLYSETGDMRPGRPWPEEIKKRLEEQVYTHLRPLGVDMEIMLIIKTQKTFAKLHDQSYLGYDKIRGGSENFRRIRIFTGYLHEGDETSIRTRGQT